ncbi:MULTISPECIES: hypothetical protein [Streptomyces]|nr:hypothetical protein [Streptomyces sp. GbtcB7]
MAFEVAQPLVHGPSMVGDGLWRRHTTGRDTVAPRARGTVALGAAAP